MQCDVCSKNPATVHLTEIIEGAMTELHLCEECARQKSAQMEQQFGLSDLLAGMAEFGKPPKESEPVEIKCPNCGLTYSDFKKIGRLGCGACYEAFRRYLAPLLKRIHGSSEHLGKTPQASPQASPKAAATLPRATKKKTADAQDLRRQLQKAVETEAFEEAARLRDLIRELEKKSASPGRESSGQEKEK